ncbi:MAG: ABC transporter ATP-binding protein [Lachnospiraceae bacterium]|nr:ABC transporter ATP-binding protein [Lachnospiraceae bacterium]
MSFVLKTIDLAIGYQKKTLLRDLSLELKKGEIIAVIGPNGCGKSTLLKTISGLIDPLQGSVYLEGNNMRQLARKELARTMSVMMTERKPMGYTTCYDIVSIGRFPYTNRMGTLSEDDHTIIRKAMETTGSTGLKDLPFQQISDGQKQRVLLARALVQNPKIMILDEPTSYLDIGYKIELLHILRSLAREKDITILLSMHELELVRNIADKVICLPSDGTKVVVGTVDQVLTEQYIEELFHIPKGQFREIYQWKQNL